MGTPKSLFTEVSFLSLLSSKTVSAVASAVTWVLLPLYVYEVTGSATQSALMSAMNVVPFILFGVFAGTMVDRLAPRVIITCVEIGNMVILLVVPLALATVGLPIYVLFAVGFASSSAFVWFDVASSALIPRVAGKDRIFQANGHLWAFATVVNALAAPVGIFLLNMVGMGATFAILSGFYLLSALFISSVKDQGSVPPQRRESTTSFRSDFREGIRFILEKPVLWVLTLAGIGNGLSGGAVYTMIVVFADKSLGLAPDDTRLGWVIASSSVGAVIASIIAPKLRTFSALTTVLVLLFLEAIVFVLYAQTSWWIAAMVFIGAWNMLHTAVMIVSLSVRQVITPEELQGRVNSVGRLVAWGTVPLGAALCGFLVDFTGSSTIATTLLVIPLIFSTVVVAVGIRLAQSKPQKNVTL